MTKRAAITPDGRYIVVRGHLWRAANPHLSPITRQALVNALVAARRDVRAALAADDPTALSRARARVQAARVGLGSGVRCGGPTARPTSTAIWSRTPPYAAWAVIANDA